MKAFALLLCVVCAIGGSMQAASRTRANYSVATETLDPAGARTQSASYKSDSSAGGIAGISSAAAPSETAKHGYVAQLYEVIALSLSAPPSNNLNEGTSRQLQAAPLADDATTLAPLNPSTVAWSIVNGPISSISSGGLGTAAVVYQDTPAAIGGSALGLSGQFNLTVLNVNIDDYLAYAGDGMDDAWQVQYFGQPPNPLAGPNADPDGDGQANLFEYTAGLVPVDPSSRFVLQVTPGSSADAKNLVFHPLVTGRSYSVQFTTDLAAADWNALTGTTLNDAGTQRTVTDPNATGAEKFYRVQIARP